MLPPSDSQALRALEQFRSPFSHTWPLSRTVAGHSECSNSSRVKSSAPRLPRSLHHWASESPLYLPLRAFLAPDSFACKRSLMMNRRLADSDSADTSSRNLLQAQSSCSRPSAALPEKLCTLHLLR